MHTDHSWFTHRVMSAAPGLQAFFREHVIAPTGLHIFLFPHSTSATLQSEHAPTYTRFFDFRHEICLLHFLILFLLKNNSSARFYTALLSIPQWLSHYSWILVKLYQSHRFMLKTDMQTPIWWHRLKSTFQNTMIVSEPLANNINPYICYPMENFRYSEKILAYFLSLQWYINKPSLLAESLKTKEVIFRLRPALD